MAILSSDKKSVTVQRGDTLSGIARTYLGSASKYTQLAAINNISNPNRISIGQVIKLYSSGSGGGSSSSSSTAMTKPVVKHFGIQSDTERTLFATWTWNRGHTESYKVVWEYYTTNKIWFVGKSQSISVDKYSPELAKQDTYDIPDNATQVRFKVKAISKVKDSQNNTYHWTCGWSTSKKWNKIPLNAPSTPSVKIDKYKLTAELETVPDDCTQVEFEIVRDNSYTYHKSKAIAVSTGYVSYSCEIKTGGLYKVRCRSVKGSQHSEWSAYSGNESSMPATPSGFEICRANSKTSVYLEWSKKSTAKSYEIEYTKEKKEYFDITSETSTVSNIETTKYEITGLSIGYEYFFRLRAVNEDNVKSDWSEISGTVLGTKPAAPTTWSSTTTVITGEPLTLYWVHNSKDGSSQTYAELEVYLNAVWKDGELIGGTKLVIPTIKNTDDEELKDKTSSYVIATKDYPEGTRMDWRVKTSGVTNEFGDWSVMRTVNIYAPPTLELNILEKNEDNSTSSIDTITEFPFYISALAGPNTQSPIGYHVTIVADEMYETTDNIGNLKTINAGDAVYSKYFDITDALMVELSAGNIDLENNISYTVKCTVSMNSGLTADSEISFTVNWNDILYQPNAEIGIDRDSFTAFIRPYCEQGELINYKVTFDGYAYTKTNEQITSGVYGEIIYGETTTTGEPVYSGVDENGDELYYCTVESKSLVENILLSVYRREFDGRFIEIATGLDNSKNVTVTDPHPSLDYARYRIVAASTVTGAVSYYDLPGYPVNGIGIVIQWDEQWTNFDVTEDAELSQPPWSGSLLNLIYNIDTSESTSQDVTLVKYIGRENPVSYYGTQVGDSGNWSTVIPKDDKETLYALRRLQKWMGDVYVREPSGVGYWANIAVSLSTKHTDLTVPVSLSVTRVEGGV